MKKNFLCSLMLGLMTIPASWGADYGLPAAIPDGNILHCFNWPAKDVEAALPQIAAAGFGSVQLSPLQRPDAKVGYAWHDLYRPYDLAFKSSSWTSEADLKSLCAKAKEYGIKVIVDVVANHVDKTAGYHDTWWDANGRVRWNGGINYGDRYSITHGQLGDYGDVNSELSEVAARGKAYVEQLKEMGVSGCRWDAAKHIGLPSEGCQFWAQVTSVPDMWHYGEILDSPGPDASIIKEYGKYMSVTDNEYSNYAAKSNGGIPGGYGGSWAVNHGLGDKVIYWAESHDTYSNDEWSQNVDQSVIDRAYAAYACRKDAAALYLSRPNAKGFDNIKIGKGSTAFTSKHISEVNKFRNTMVGKADWCEAAGNTFTVTRENGGAVIVSKGSGNVSVVNGGGYCPAGTYTDRVSGGTFTVTGSTISGNVGPSGIAVLIKDGLEPPIGGGGDDPIIITPPTVDGDMWIIGNLEGAAGWSTTPGTGAAMTLTDGKYVAKNVKLAAAANETSCYFNLTDYVGATWDDLNTSANRFGSATEGEPITLGTPASVVKYANDVNASGCLSWTIPAGTYDFTFDPSAMKLTVVNAGGGGDDPIIVIPPVNDDGYYVYFDDMSKSDVAVWAWTTNDVNCTASGNWPGDRMTQKDGKYYWSLPEGKEVPTQIIISWGGHNDADKAGGGDLAFVNKAIYHADGTYTVISDPIPTPTKPVVTANPAGGTTFTDEYINVTLTVSPAATIYYTIDGTTPTTSSTKYESPIAVVETTTIKTLAVTEDGAQNSQSFSYTKRTQGGDDPIVITGDNLITEYYKVNPNGQVGTNKTINMSFTGEKSNTALNNWTEAELIAQGVARDVCQAFKGVHERPIVDSYALYAAYDSQNLYLGVQYVYTIWDLYGEGKQPGESKPYNMDGKLCFAFDLDPEKSAEGITNENSSIWQGGVFTTFNNGSDAWWFGSTKPGVGTPGFFVPNASGVVDYTDSNSNKPSTVKYGYADGLLPSINAVYGQDDFSYDPELLKGNAGFVDLRSEIDDSAHTFYEYTFPLSLLGVTEDYIKNNGIGVMVVDFYGASAHASLPYDPSFYDNVNESYSQDPSSSAEKEDKDVVTFAHARIGKLAQQSAVETLPIESVDAEAAPVYYNLQGVQVANPGKGMYIVVRGNKVSKEVIR